MRPRFQADNDLDQRIVVATRRLEPAIDFQTAQALNLYGVSDEDVLALAAHTGRILVTHDRKTIPEHFSNFIARQDSPGVVIISQKTPIGEAAENLHILWGASEAEEYVNVIYSLP
jgi:predicted nuclease of predicted toxin-antitoxin system